MKKRLKQFGLILLVLVLLIASLAIFLTLPLTPKKNPTAKLGITYSVLAAEALGLDAKKAFSTILNELNPDIVRLPVYWNLLEPTKGEYQWDFIDAQLERVKETETEVILAIGHKLPRWPECHLPEWIEEETVDQDLERLVTAIVTKYKDHPNLYAWQVQNEVLFTFGECPEWSGSRKRLKKLISLVKELDPKHKVTTSDSGELSLWAKTSTLPIDALSISLYRVAYNPNHDYFYWPVNPYYYKLHAALVKPFVPELIISELQMEPWGPAPVQQLDLAEVYKSFSPFHFDERIEFAQQTGATTILTWGVEWWYYMKEVQQEPIYWEKAVNQFNQ